MNEKILSTLQYVKPFFKIRSTYSRQGRLYLLIYGVYYSTLVGKSGVKQSSEINTGEIHIIAVQINITMSRIQHEQNHRERRNIDTFETILSEYFYHDAMPLTLLSCKTF